MASRETSDPYIRWQEIRIQQLGYVNNLVLGLAVGVLAFETSLVEGNAARFYTAPWLASLSLGLATASVAFGLVAGVTRLLDFRLTAQLHRTEDEETKVRLRCRADKFGNWTWKLLWLQLSTFAASGVLSILWFGSLVLRRVA